MASCLEVRRLVELVQFAGMYSAARAGRLVIGIKLSSSYIVNFHVNLHGIVQRQF